MALLVVFHESVQHIIDGFSVMKRITNMYPNTFFESENIHVLILESWEISNIIKTVNRGRICLLKFNLCTFSIMCCSIRQEKKEPQR